MNNTCTSYEDYISAGIQIRETKDTTQWALGDLALEVVGKIEAGEFECADKTISDYADDIGCERRTLGRYRSMSAFFPCAARRAYKLSHTHFRIAWQYSETLTQAQDLLALASDNNLTTRALEAHCKQQKNEQQPSENIFELALEAMVHGGDSYARKRVEFDEQRKQLWLEVPREIRKIIDFLQENYKLTNLCETPREIKTA